MSPQRRLHYYNTVLARRANPALAVEYGSSELGVEVNDLPSDQELLDDDAEATLPPHPSKWPERKRKEADDGEAEKTPKADNQKTKGGGRQAAQEDEEDPGVAEEEGEGEFGAEEAEEDPAEDDQGAEEDEEGEPPGDEEDAGEDQETDEADAEDGEEDAPPEDQPARGAKSKELKITASEYSLAGFLLMEAGINVTMVGNWEKGSSFTNKSDRGILNSPKGQDKIRRLFQRMKFDADINAVFVNNKEGRKYREWGEVGVDWLAGNMPDTTMELASAQPDFPHAMNINILFTNNVAAGRHPMTAWIIAHRVSHAFFGASGRDSTTEKLLTRAMNRFIGVVSESLLLDGFGLQSMKNALMYAEKFGYNNVFRKMEATGIDSVKLYSALFNSMGTFRSAREGKINRPLEFFHELFAQYMLTGTCTLNPPPLLLKAGKQTFRMPESDQDYYHQTIGNELDALIESFDEALIAAKGRIYVM